MNIKSIIDKTAIAVASRLVTGVRYFADGIESERLVDLARKVDLEVPPIEGPGFIQAAGTCGGMEINPALLVHHWYGWDAPTVIYHHGAAEGGFTFSFKGIFGKKPPEPINVLAICAPYSKTNKEFYGQIRTLAGYAALIAGSAATVEAVLAQHRARSASRTLVCGVSLGGAVSCLHAATFGSADIWMPLYAGPDLGDVFVDSAYAPMCDQRARDEHADAIRRVLNFGAEFRDGPIDRIHPVLGRYDQYFQLDVHLPYYLEQNVTITEMGHATGSTTFAFMRSRVIASMEDTCEYARPI